MDSRAKKCLIASAVLAALTLAGCPKKESPEDIEFAAQQAKKAAQAKKKVDVFDEFYVDDTKKAAADSKTKGSAKGKAEAPAATAAAPAVAKQQSAPLPAASGSFSKNGRYVVQVNSTASEGEANRMAAKLKNLGYPAYVVSVQNPTPSLTGTYFRVRLGGFDSYSEAKAFAEGTLASAGYDYWVDRKANDNVGIQGGGFGPAGGQQQYKPAAPPPPQQPQQYQPTAAPQPYRPATTPQQYQPGAAPQQYQSGTPPQQYQPAQPPQQYQQAPAQQQFKPATPVQQAAPPVPPPQQAPQPVARPQQTPPPPPPAPAPAPQPAAKPQQTPPATPASKQPAAQPKQNEWGTTDDWGSDDW